MRLNRHEIRAEAGRILWLAWPVILTSLNWTLLHLIDVAVVGRVSTHELGALAAGRTLTFVSIVVGISALSGVLVFTSRADGAGNLPRCGEVLREGIVLSAAMGLLFMVILLLWAEPLVSLVGVSPELTPGGVRVVQAMALAYPPQFLMAAAAYTLEGVSQPRRPMLVNLATLPINGVLAWAWTGGHLGFPEEGAAGAAYATALTSVFGAVAMLAATWTLPRAREMTISDMSPSAWRRAIRGVPSLLSFGFIPALGAGLELVGFSWLIALSTQLGATAAAAFQMVFSLHNFAFALALGFGSAAGVRAGNAVGAGEPEKAFPRSLIAAGLAIVGMVLVSGLYLYFAEEVLHPFTTDPAVLALAVVMLTLWAPFIFLDGIQVVFVYALRSLGEQVAAGINGIIAFFVVTGGLGWLLVRWEALGPEALVYASVAGMITAATLQSWWMIRVSARIRQSSTAADSLRQAHPH